LRAAAPPTTPAEQSRTASGPHEDGQNFYQDSLSPGLPKGCDHDEYGESLEEVTVPANSAQHCSVVDVDAIEGINDSELMDQFARMMTKAEQTDASTKLTALKHEVAAAEDSLVVYGETPWLCAADNAEHSDDEEPLANALHIRKSKAARAAYAKMVRSLKGKKAAPPAEVLEAFDKGTKSKGALFTAWLANDGDWAEVSFTVGLSYRTTDSTKSSNRLMSRSEIEEKYKNKAVADSIIAAKTQAGLYVDNPDCPELVEARLYKVFDSTYWDNTHEDVCDRTLSGEVAPNAKQAAALANQLLTHKLPGPIALSKAAPLSIEYVDTAGDTKRVSTKKPPVVSANKKMVTFLATLAKAMEVDKVLEKQIAACEKAENNKGDAFVTMLTATRSAMLTTYNALRENTSGEQNSETCGELKKKLEGEMAAAKIDATRISKVFPTEPAATPKAKAKGKAKSKAAKSDKAAPVDGAPST